MGLYVLPPLTAHRIVRELNKQPGGAVDQMDVATLGRWVNDQRLRRSEAAPTEFEGVCRFLLEKVLIDASLSPEVNERMLNILLNQLNGPDPSRVATPLTADTSAAPKVEADATAVAGAAAGADATATATTTAVPAAPAAPAASTATADVTCDSPLQSAWEIWHIPPEKAMEGWDKALTVHVKFDTIGGFWGACVDVPKPPFVPRGHFFMMRADHKPMFEVPVHKGGGRLRFSVSTNRPARQHRAPRVAGAPCNDSRPHTHRSEVRACAGRGDADYTARCTADASPPLYSVVVSPHLAFWGRR